MNRVSILGKPTSYEPIREKIYPLTCVPNSRSNRLCFRCPLVEIFASLPIQNAHSEESDQTVRMHRLLRNFLLLYKRQCRTLLTRLALVVFVLYLFLSFSTLFFFIMILFNPTSSYLWLNQGTEINKDSTS